MKDNKTIFPIAYIKNDFLSKFGVPRQSGIANSVISKIVFEKQFQGVDYFRGLEEYSHIWLIWGFSLVGDNDYSATVRPPRLGGNKRMGVFATRSPFRPNHLGLSSVKIERIEKDRDHGITIYVSGADLVDGTPIYDIKPYLSFTDSHPDSINGFASNTGFCELEVKFCNDTLNIIDREDIDQIISILSQDPRPSYQNDKERTYCFEYGKYKISFKVSDNELIVTDLKKLQEGSI